MAVRLLSLFVLASVLFGGMAQAATLTYAGAGNGVDPCNTTLSSCINGSTAGDTVEIATNELINETLYIGKSVTLTSASGFTGTIGSGDPAAPQFISIGPNTDAVVTLDHLDLTTSAVDSIFESGSGTSALTIRNCTIGGWSGRTDDGIYVTWTSPMSITIEGNELVGTGTDDIIELDVRTTSGNSPVTVVGNEFWSTGGSGAGLYLEPNGTGSATMLVANNVLHDLSQGIIVSASATGNSTVNVLNNTLDSMNGGVDISNTAFSGTLAVNLFNNILTNMSAYGFNMHPSTAGLTQTVDYNDVYRATNSLNGVTYGTHNISADPEYRYNSPQSYALFAGSPAIGTGVIKTALPDTDYEGFARTVLGHIDMGAYQSGQSDVAVSLGVNPPVVHPGDNVTITAAVVDNTAYDAPDALLTFHLPDGLDFASVSTPVGSCFGVGTVTCDLGAISAGRGVNVTLIATAETVGDQKITADVTGGQTDPIPDNNSADVTVSVTQEVVDAGVVPVDAGVPPAPDAGTVAPASDGGINLTVVVQEKSGCDSTAATDAFALLVPLAVWLRRRTSKVNGKNR